MSFKDVSEGGLPNVSCEVIPKRRTVMLCSNVEHWKREHMKGARWNTRLCLSFEVDWVSFCSVCFEHIGMRSDPHSTSSSITGREDSHTQNETHFWLYAVSSCGAFCFSCLKDWKKNQHQESSAYHVNFLTFLEKLTKSVAES